MQIASDLHLEMHTKGLPPLEQLPVPTAPVLALLGDVSALGEPGGRAIFEEFLSACHERWRVILLLAGNHEFHTCSAPREQLRTAREVLACMRGLTDRFPKLRVLQNEAITIDGVRVVGSVLWTHVPPCMTVDGPHRKADTRKGEDPALAATRTVEYRMPDYRRIYVEPAAGAERPRPRPITVADANGWHREARAFLEAEAAAATAARTNLLVLTHHTPSFEGTSDPVHAVDPQGTSSGSSTGLHGLMRDARLAAVHTWCFGHTHHDCDQCVHGVRLVFNQRGCHFAPSERCDPATVVTVPRVWADRRPPAVVRTRPPCAVM